MQQERMIQGSVLFKILRELNEVTDVMDNVLSVACGVSHSLLKVNQQLLVCGSIAAGNHSAAISCGNLQIWGSGCFGTFSKPMLFLSDIVDVKINGTLGLGVDNQGQLYSWGSNVNEKNEEIEGLTNQLQNFKNSLKQYQDDETSQLNQFKHQLSE